MSVSGHASVHGVVGADEAVIVDRPSVANALSREMFSPAKVPKGECKREAGAAHLGVAARSAWHLILQQALCASSSCGFAYGAVAVWAQGELQAPSIRWARSASSQPQPGPQQRDAGNQEGSDDGKYAGPARVGDTQRDDGKNDCRDDRHGDGDGDQ